MQRGDKNMNHRHEIPQGGLRSGAEGDNPGSTTGPRVTTQAKEMWETYKISQVVFFDRLSFEKI